jgi:hypothetical protein
MFEGTSKGFANGFFIRLRDDHLLRGEAELLLSALGGCGVLPTDRTVYLFVRAWERDDALQLLRRELGWTVASSFDGSPWLRSDPAARWLPFPSKEMEGVDNWQPDVAIMPQLRF